MRKIHLLDLRVLNILGALDQIALLVRRSGWNIEDIMAGDIEEKKVYRIVMHVAGLGEVRLLQNQLLRLECVLSADTSDSAELEETLSSISERLKQIK